VAAGIAAEGLRVLDAGEVPTPALALAALEAALPAVMVTGSHIPADRNGLKFYGPAGEIGKEDEAGILEALESVGEESLPAASAEAAMEVLPEYVARCRRLAGEGALGGRRIGIWQHSSVFRDGLADLMVALGAEIVPLGRAATFVALDTEAVAETDRARIRAWTREERLDALVSTDGDGDRPLVADETG